MPDISNQMSYLSQLQDVRNPNSPMGALDRLGSSIGSAWQGHQRGTDEQEATKYFMENPTSPETIQTFAASHPQMPLMDVYRYAGAIATQKKAQKMKDRVKTLQDSLASGAEMDEKLLSTLFKDMAPDELMEFQKILTGAQQAGLNFKSLKEKDRFKPIGAQGLYDVETRGIIGKPAEKTTPADQADRAVKILMTKTNTDTGEKYTEDEAYIKIHHRPNTETRKLLTPEEEAQQKRIREAGRTPERPAKVTATVALNPVTGQNEYLMTDGSFSGKIAAKVSTGVKGADIKRVSDMVKAAGDEPTPNDIVTINEAANGIGYNYENVTETKPGRFWGTNTASMWKLVPKAGGEKAAPEVKLSESSLRVDLIKNGHTPQSADEYITRAKAAGKL